MQGGLVGHPANQQGFVICLRRDRKAAKPVRPFLVEESLHPDVIDGWFAERSSIGHKPCLVVSPDPGQVVMVLAKPLLLCSAYRVGLCPV